MIDKLSPAELLSDAGYDTDSLKLTGLGKGYSGTWQETLAHIWKALTKVHNDETNIFAHMTVGQAIENITDTSRKEMDDAGPHFIDICVTGSLYIVGSALSACDWNEEEADGYILNSKH